MAKGSRKLSPSEGAERIVCRNRRATFDFEIEDRYEAGLVLVGTEVKSLRAGKASINEAYAKVEGNAAWLEGAHIAEYPWAHQFNHEPLRRRKLLLHAAELDRLATKVNERGYTLVPIALYFRQGRAKVELGLGRGKRQFDKRETIKKRDVERDIERYR